MNSAHETPARGDTDPDPRMTALHDIHARPLYRFLLRLTFGDRQAAEDLLQETFLRAWRHLDQMPTELASLRPWLYTVARRIAIDAARTRQARPTEVASADLTTVASEDRSIERLVAVQAIRTALPRLSPDHRRVLLEVYIRERSIQEAAAILGIPEGTVKSRTHHALRTLRAALGE